MGRYLARPRSGSRTAAEAVSTLFPKCPVGGCTDAEPCEECQGAAVCLLALALGTKPPRKYQAAAERKMARWGNELWKKRAEEECPWCHKPDEAPRDMWHWFCRNCGHERMECSHLMNRRP